MVLETDQLPGVPVVATQSLVLLAAVRNRFSGGRNHVVGRACHAPGAAGRLCGRAISEYAGCGTSPGPAFQTTIDHV